MSFSFHKERRREQGWDLWIGKVCRCHQQEAAAWQVQGFFFESSFDQEFEVQGQHLNGTIRLEAGEGGGHRRT